MESQKEWTFYIGMYISKNFRIHILSGVDFLSGFTLCFYFWFTFGLLWAHSSKTGVNLEYTLKVNSGLRLGLLSVVLIGTV